MTTSTHDPLAASRRDAAKRLAALVTLETGVEISTDTMLALVLKNWDRIAALAHQIHGTERKAPDIAKSSAWIPWSGGDCPVPDDTEVLVRFRSDNDGIVPYVSVAGNLRWGWGVARDSDIVAYYVMKP